MQDQKVRCYYNLHKEKISVQEKVGKTWKVVEHTNSIHLSQVKFLVSKAGRERVVKQKRKNVHAFVEGYRVKKPVDFYTKVVSYNPYKADYFFIKDTGEKITQSNACSIIQKTIMSS